MYAWESFRAFLLFAEIFHFFFSKNLSEMLIQCQTLWIQIGGPDLGPKCLQRLTADDTSRQQIT